MENGAARETLQSDPGPPNYAILARSMRARAGRRTASLLRLGLLLCLAAAPAAAQTAPAGSATPSGTTSPENAEAARQHFQRGRELYQAGAYREAIVELEAAHKLDPRAKDLVFNLGVVNDRLGRIEDALRYFHQYTQMDLTTAERARADTYIRRLEGAKHEVVPATTAVPPPPPTPPPPPPEQPKPPPKGRIDVATVIAATVAIAGFGVGIGFGIKAMTDNPSNYVAGRDGSYQDLQNRL